MQRFIFALLLCIIPSVSLAATEELWVRPQADCANNGTGKAYGCAATPGALGAWRGFNSLLFSTTDETASRVDPGDIVHVCGAFVAADVQQAGTMLNVAAGGANTQVITWDGDCTAYGGTARATLDGGSTTATGIYTADRTLHTIKNMTVSNFTSRGAKLYLDAVTDRPIVKQNIMQNVSVNSVRGTTAICIDNRGQNVTLLNVAVDSCGLDGIFSIGKNYLLDGFRATNISLDNVNAGDGAQISEEIDGNIVRNGYVDMTAVDSKYCVIVSDYTDTGTFLIEKNTCIRTLSDIQGSCFLAYSKTGMTGTLRQNTCYGGVNGFQVFFQQGTLNIIANTIDRPTNDCVLLGGSDAGTTNVRNNTCIDPARYGVSNTNTSVSLTIQNNIVTGPCTAAVERRSSNVEDHNVLYNCTNAVTVTGVPSSTGSGTVTTDPLILSSSNLRVGLGSPARNAGVTYSGCIDLLGRACFSTPTIGAYQISTTSPDGASTRMP